MVDRSLGPAGDPAVVASKRKDEKLAQIQWEADLRKLLMEPWGRRIAFRLLGETGLYSTSVIVHTDGRSIDPHMTHVREGRRNLGIWLESELQRVDTELWLQMHRDRFDAARKEKKR